MPNGAAHLRRSTIKMNLSEEQIKHGFWIWEPPNKRPPGNIHHPDDYHGEEEMHCVPTQHSNVTPYQQKKITRLWCEKLPEFTNLKVLWFHSRVPQDLFDAACGLPNIEAIYIKWSGIKNLEHLSNCPQLRHLHLGSSTQVQSIEPISSMTNLITLSLVSLKRIQDYKPLSCLSGLQGLSIDGSMWTTQKLDELEFLRPLKNLRFLTLGNTRLVEKSFDSILSLPELVRFECSWNYAENEFEKLKSHPKLKYGNVETSWKEIKETYGF